MPIGEWSQTESMAGMAATLREAAKILGGVVAERTRLTDLE